MPARIAGWSPRWWRLGVGAVAVMVALLVLGLILGGAWRSSRSDLGGWHTGRAYIGSKEVSIEYHGWYYGADHVVGEWRDRHGTWHESGWPACLRLRGHGVRTAEVRFQTRQVTVGERTWRPIVAVDCRR